MYLKLTTFQTPQKTSTVIINVCLVIVSYLLTSILQADDMGDHIKTLSLSADYGFSTSKSETMESNDTGSTTRINLNINAGSNLDLGVTLNMESATYVYELNETGLASSFQDFYFSYRWAWFRFGAIISNTVITATDTNGDEYLNLAGSGFGGIFDVYYPASRSALVYLKTAYAMTSKAEDQVQTEVAVGPRLTVDIGASVDLSKKMFDLIFGYRQQTYSLTIDSTATNELSTTTYVGVSMGLSF